jgi:hypothetical protein
MWGTMGVGKWNGNVRKSKILKQPMCIWIYYTYCKCWILGEDVDRERGSKGGVIWLKLDT